MKKLVFLLVILSSCCVAFGQIHFVDTLKGVQQKAYVKFLVRNDPKSKTTKILTMEKCNRQVCFSAEVHKRKRKDPLENGYMVVVPAGVYYTVGNTNKSYDLFTGKPNTMCFVSLHVVTENVKRVTPMGNTYDEEVFKYLVVDKL